MRAAIKSMIDSMKEKMNSIGAESMMRNMQEKMNSLGAHSQSMLNNTTAKLKEMVSNMQEKLKEIGAENMVNNRRAKMKQSGPEDRIKNLQENLKELLKTAERIGRRMVSPPDKELPLQTTREKLQLWLHLNAPYVLMGLILLVLLWCCCRCFRYLCRTKNVKTMKAPGRNFRMPRSNFEANPRSYFRNLRSAKPKYG